MWPSTELNVLKTLSHLGLKTILEDKLLTHFTDEISPDHKKKIVANGRVRICGPNWPFSQNTILPSLDHSTGQLVSTQHELQSLRSTLGNACQANKPTWWGGRAENQSVWRFHSSFITAVTWKQLARGRGGYTTGKYHVGAKSGMSVNHVNTWKYLWKTSLSKKK